MKLKLTTGYTERYSNEDLNKELGIITSYDLESPELVIVESVPYIYRNENYIFFKSLLNLFDYYLNGSLYIERAYLTEEDFDKYYDMEFLEEKFSEKLEWVSK